MYASAFVRRKEQAGEKSRLAWRRATEQAQIACAAAGLFGGVASAMFGAVFTGASWFVANEGARSWLSTAGAILLVLTIPLLILGGFCMDWLEKEDPRRDPKGARYEDDEEGQ
jgi:apolipoprotein N-acyltransferase